MDPILKIAFDKTVSMFENDSRVVAAYHSGSVGTDREDEFSDVDPVFLIKPEEFIKFDEELPQLFEKEIAKPILWWPERWIWVPGYGDNVNNSRNYAIFFRMDDHLLQYDINIMGAPQDRRIKVKEGQFIFDKINVLEIISEQPLPALNKDKLGWTIEMYWIYVYIHVKYLKRRDLFRLLYAQQELFQEHLVILRYLQPDIPQQWWPLMAVSASKIKALPIAVSSMISLFNYSDTAILVYRLAAEQSIFEPANGSVQFFGFTSFFIKAFKVFHNRNFKCFWIFNFPFSACLLGIF